MPAANSMVKYDASLNSGFSSGFPSFMLPYLEKYRTIINTAQASWVPMYIQVKVRVIHVFHSAICELAASGSIMHQTTKPQIIAEETKETTGFKRMLIPRFELPSLHHFQFTRNQRHLLAASSCSLLALLALLVSVSILDRRFVFDCNVPLIQLPAFVAFSALLCHWFINIFQADIAMTGGTLIRLAAGDTHEWNRPQSMVVLSVP